MLWIDPLPLGFDIWALVERAKAEGLRMGGSRLVIHIQTSQQACDDLVSLVKTMKEECAHAAEEMSEVEKVQNERFAVGDWGGMSAPKKLARMGVTYGGKK
jgi:hypothetical protein